MARDYNEPIEWLEDTLRYRNHLDGEPLTPQRLGNDFLRMKAPERAQKLAELDRLIADSHMSVEQAGKIHSYRREMVRNHNAALKVKR